MVRLNSSCPGSAGLPQARGGFALPMVLFVLAFLGIVGAGAVTSASFGRTSSRSVLASEQAFLAADAGISRWMANWPSTTTDTMTSGSRINLGTTTLPGGTFYRGWIDRVDAGTGNPIWALTVTGGSRSYGGGQRTVRVWRRKGGSFPAGIMAKGKVTFSGGGITDAYNSLAGPYGGGNLLSQGNVVTNGDLVLSGGSRVNGNATTGGTVNDHSAVTGTITQGSPPVTIPDIPCPSGGYTPASQVPLGSTGSTYSGGKLTVKNTLILPAGTYYFLEISMSGGAQLAINSGSITIYVAGKVTSSGGGGFNNMTMDPTRFALIACGANIEDMTISGGGGAYYSVYAPNSKVNVTGGGNVWGAVVGKEINNTGGSNVHVDLALLTVPNNGVIRGGWTQLSY